MDIFIYDTINSMNKKEWGPIKDQKFWIEELKKAGVLDSLKPFGSVSVSREEPDTSSNPQFKDLLLDGTYCNVYLIFDSKKELSSLYIHQKNGPEKQPEDSSFNPLSTDNPQSDRNQIDAEKHEG